ncbi:MAG: hypothetical protein ABJC79_11830 [Acidimicrobiia bacterium]
MTSDSVLPPHRASAFRNRLEGVQRLAALPIVQWALLILAMLLLLALTKSSVAESPYNNF